GRRFDTDEHTTEICFDHRIQQFRPRSKINRSFCEEPEGIPVAALPSSQLPGELQSRLVISDKIVVDNEYFFPPAELQKRVEFSNQLRRGLRPRTASVQRDDVAKITGERAASRKLHRHGTVFF